ASDLYSLGVTMYQMLTGVLPYDTPSPADLERLYRGDLVSPPRLKNTQIPKRINDIILQAMAPDVGTRYQRASDLLDDLLAARPAARRLVTRRTPEARGRAPGAPAARGTPPDAGEMASIQSRLRARETPQPRFCWKCRKALHSRAGRCPFCGEPQ